MSEKPYFKEDKRFKQCNKELMYTLVFFIINIVLVGGISLMAYNKPANEITMVAGFPAWFFYGCIIASAILCILTIIMVKTLFKDMSLDAYVEGEEE